MKIPFHRPAITDAEISEVVETLRSGWLTTGPKVKQFEREFAAYLGHRQAVAVNSCTAALHLALEAVGLKEGEGVVVPTMTFAATAEVVRYLGGRPILVDCRDDDFNLDTEDAEVRIRSALSANQPVKAIMPVHYGGQIGDVDGVQMLARRYGLKVIEDAAHCCPAYYAKAGSGKQKAEKSKEQGAGSWAGKSAEEGARSLEQEGESREQGVGSGEPDATLAHPMGEGLGVRARSKLQALSSVPLTPHSALRTPHSDWLPVGSSADISCYSFYANKCITTGEGGMACTNNEEYAERMRIMSLHGISKDAWKRYTGEGSWYYEIVAPGYKYNLTDIAAAIGLHQIRRADELHRCRTELANRYCELLKDVEEIRLPVTRQDRIHSWHLYVIRLRLDRLNIDRARFIAELQQRGIGTSVHWMPLHMHPYYRETYGYTPGDLPVACAAYPEIITLPLYPGMSEQDVQFVCESIKDIVTRNLKGRAGNPLKNTDSVGDEVTARQ